MRIILSLISIVFLCTSITLQAKIIYINNVKGNDSFNGLAAEPAGDGVAGPVASIQKGFSLIRTSDRVEIANTEKPYQRPYPGKKGCSLRPVAGGTLEKPVVINGNGAVISGLSVIESKHWKKLEGHENLYSIYFMPMSNKYKGAKEENYWLDETQIWWVDGKAAPNCKSMEELKKTPGGFWWNKIKSMLVFHLPADKKLESLKIEIPANAGIYVSSGNTIVKDLNIIFSWNDGFDIANFPRNPKNVVYMNCNAYNNCGQGFSCHGTGNAYYENCSAIRCASSGSCDVNWCNSTYKNCLFINNTYEAGVYTTEESIHNYDDCLIVMNRPFEQIWQVGHSKMNFYNCVIVGCADDKSILKLNRGSVSFKNCTLLNAASICRIPEKSPCTLNIQNCIMAHCRDFFLDIPADFKGRISLGGNLYMDAPGNLFKGKLYGKNNWNEYVKLKIEKNSEWKTFKLTGPLNTELPKEVKKEKKFAKNKIGAALPERVWKRYFRLLKEVPTPQGIMCGK